MPNLILSQYSFSLRWFNLIAIQIIYFSLLLYLIPNLNCFFLIKLNLFLILIFSSFLLLHLIFQLIVNFL